MPEQQNQQLINNLIENQKTSAYQQQVALEPEENELLVTRVVTAKYKVYVIILLILGLLLWMTYIPQATSHYDGKVADYENKLNRLNSMEQQISQFKQDTYKLLSIHTNEKTVIQCINEKEGCDQLPENLSWDLWTAVSYIQLGSLSSDKMGFDEEKIIRNLDHYLIKNSPEETELSSNNGRILSIQMWEPQSVGTAGLNRLSINLQITFDEKDDLITFVDNIEKYIISVPEDRILYFIDEVSYDIMAYDESQTTTIWLTAYYFK